MKIYIVACVAYTYSNERGCLETGEYLRYDECLSAFLNKEAANHRRQELVRRELLEEEGGAFWYKIAAVADPRFGDIDMPEFVQKIAKECGIHFSKEREIRCYEDWGSVLRNWLKDENTREKVLPYAMKELEDHLVDVIALDLEDITPEDQKLLQRKTPSTTMSHSDEVKQQNIEKIDETL